MLKLVRCVKIGKTGERKNGNYGLYKGCKNQDFKAKYSPLNDTSYPFSKIRTNAKSTVMPPTLLQLT